MVQLSLGVGCREDGSRIGCQTSVSSPCSNVPNELIVVIGVTYINCRLSNSIVEHVVSRQGHELISVGAETVNMKFRSEVGSHDNVDIRRATSRASFRGPLDEETQEVVAEVGVKSGHIRLIIIIIKTNHFLF